jgi:predicted PurR-regulated permease PerM
LYRERSDAARGAVNDDGLALFKPSASSIPCSAVKPVVGIAPACRRSSRLGIGATLSARATVNGTVAAAILKGAIIGIGYVPSGVPYPLLFTVLTMTLAMVPPGAWLALAAAALILPVHDGSWLVAAGLFSFGAATLLIGENVIQPALIGGAVRLPFLLVLIGILGGMQSFGLLGLFLGP